MFKKIAILLSLFLGLGQAAVPLVTLPLDWTGAAGISRSNLNLNPIALRDGLNAAIDSLNPILTLLTGYSNSLALASNQDLILKVDVDANGTNKFVVTANNLDSLFRVQEGGPARLFNGLGVDSSLTVGKTLSVTGKITGSDTLAALLGFRAGNTAASNVNLYRLSADMWKTDDSLTVAGKVSVTDSLLGSSARFSGRVTADTLVSTKFYNDTGSFTATITGCTTAPTMTVKYVRVGKSVTLNIPNTGALISNSTSFGFTGLPSSLQPTTAQIIPLYMVRDNSVTGVSTGAIRISPSTQVDYLNAGQVTGWTASGSKANSSILTTGQQPATYILP
jgi:hypothetical protein